MNLPRAYRAEYQRAAQDKREHNSLMMILTTSRLR
jgi:hypothetical protein